MGQLEIIYSYFQILFCINFLFLPRENTGKQLSAAYFISIVVMRILLLFFIQDVFRHENVICVGAGIGVTPFASILKSIW